jgi:hypothetical protein
MRCDVGIQFLLSSLHSFRCGDPNRPADRYDADRQFDPSTPFLTIGNNNGIEVGNYAPPTRTLFTGMWTKLISTWEGKVAGTGVNILSLTMYPMKPMIRKPVPTAWLILMNSRLSAARR